MNLAKSCSIASIILAALLIMGSKEEIYVFPGHHLKKSITMRLAIVSEFAIKDKKSDFCYNYQQKTTLLDSVDKSSDCRRCKRCKRFSA